MTERQKLIRNVRRVLADLNGSIAWKWNIERLIAESDYTLHVRIDGLASDEINAMQRIMAGVEK